MAQRSLLWNGEPWYGTETSGMTWRPLVQCGDPWHGTKISGMAQRPLIQCGDPWYGVVAWHRDPWHSTEPLARLQSAQPLHSPSTA